MKTELREATSKHDYGYCAGIRAIVFLKEQQCENSIQAHYDMHEDTARHFLLLTNGKPVATARYRMVEPETAKIERVAVLKDYRGRGYGRDVIVHVTEHIKAQPKINKITLSAQDHAISFYEQMGYNIVGKGYMESGIPHHRMDMDLDQTG